MFVAFCSAIGRRALARSVPGWQAPANFVLALACAHGVSPKTTGWCRLHGDRLSTEAFRRMARVALIKLFTGLNLGVSQLSGELQRAGHDTRIIYFKDFLVVPVEEPRSYLVTDYAWRPGRRARQGDWSGTASRRSRTASTSCCSRSCDEFHPDLIGFSLTSLTMKPAAASDRAAEAALSRAADHLGRRRVRRSSPSGASSTPTWCAPARARS